MVASTNKRWFALALLSDIPARTLAEIEYGLQRLDYESRSRLARIFGLPPDQLYAGATPTPHGTRKAAWRRSRGRAFVKGMPPP